MIPNSKELAPKRQVLRYPGLKEDVYVPGVKATEYFVTLGQAF